MDWARKGAAKPLLSPITRGQAGVRRTTADLRGTAAGPHKVGGALARRGVRVWSHFPTRFEPKFSICKEIFQCRKNFDPKSCEIAQESARPDDGRPPRHSNRSSQGPLSTGATRRAGFVAISIAFRTEMWDLILKSFSVPQKFPSEIVRDRARISAAGRRPTSAALRQVLTRSAEHLHDAERGFLSRFESRFAPKIFDFFSVPQKFSCEIV